MALVIVYSLSLPENKDAPLIIVFNGMPLLDRLVAAVVSTSHGAITKEAAEVVFGSCGLTDKTLARLSVLLATAKQSGEWPSIENRLEDGSLMCWQLLTLHDVATVKDKLLLNLKRRAAKKN